MIEFSSLVLSEPGKRIWAKGMGRAILRFLGNREIEVSEEDRERIMSCTDLAQLDAWLNKSLTVTSADQLFS
ncbi:hypothetical protein [Acrocarpospora catenulata]|uniref:hypothetical protein n=1 Tax=Acrocarpospora catenulata TaxID=2836182 RepID=UPI001BD96B4E|nr:hypothetical protein [Acrocarpospora catenulata]